MLSRMSRPIRKLLALPRVERWLLVQALAALPLVTLTLRAIGLRRCYRGLERLAPRAGGGLLTGSSACHRAMRTGWLVRAASIHGLVQGSCLAQSLTIWWLLRRQRVPAELRIGVRKRQGRLEAHAWMEYQSRVLSDEAGIGRRFSPFDGVRAIFERCGADIA
jgi:Transglutaminase-like superfamily